MRRYVQLSHPGSTSRCVLVVFKLLISDDRGTVPRREPHRRCSGPADFGPHAGMQAVWRYQTSSSRNSGTRRTGGGVNRGTIRGLFHIERESAQSTAVRGIVSAEGASIPRFERLTVSEGRRRPFSFLAVRCSPTVRGSRADAVLQRLLEGRSLLGRRRPRREPGSGVPVQRTHVRHHRRPCRPAHRERGLGRRLRGVPLR